METMIIDGKEFEVFNKTLPRANSWLFQYNPKKEIPEVGKWYKFDVGLGGNKVRYAKVVEIVGNYESVKVVKKFEVPSWRPYSGKKWYDNLPWAYNPNPSEEDE